MARQRTLRVSAINVVLQPHEPALYADLWNALYALKRPVPIRGDQSLMIGAVEPVSEKDKTAGYRGYIYRFTTIDTSKPWFNRENGEEADMATVRREIRIPSHLSPNLATFSYQFFPDGHRLIVERENDKGDSLAPAFVEKLLTSLAADAKIADAFKNIDITTEQEKEKIQEIVAHEGLRELIIDVKRPNPGDDDTNADEALVFDEMNREGVRKKSVRLTASSHERLRPSESTKRLARVAKSNGKVKAVAIQDGKKIPLSSENHPEEESGKYDSDRQTRESFFEALSRRLLATLRG